MLSVKADLADQFLTLGQVENLAQVPEIQAIDQSHAQVQSCGGAGLNPGKKARNRQSKCWVAPSKLRFEMSLIQPASPILGIYSGHGISGIGYQYDQTR